MLEEITITNNAAEYALIYLEQIVVEGNIPEGVAAALQTVIDALYVADRIVIDGD